MGHWAPPLCREKILAECPECGYSLDGITGFRCTECGQSVLAIRPTNERALTGQETEWLGRTSWLDSDMATDVGCGVVGFPLTATVLGLLGFTLGPLNWGQLFIILGLVWGVFVPWVALRIWMDGRRMRHALGRDRAENRAVLGEIEVLEAVRVHEKGSQYSRWDLRLLRIADDLVLFVEDEIAMVDLGERTAKRITIEFLPHSRRILRLRQAHNERLATAVRLVASLDTEWMGRCNVVDLNVLDGIVGLASGEPRLFGKEALGPVGSG